MEKKFLINAGIILVILFIISTIFKQIFNTPYLVEIFGLLIIITIVAFLFSKSPEKNEEEKRPSLPLPTKTKIAAWWLISIGGIGVIIFIFYLMAYFSAAAGGGCLTGFVLLPFVGIPSFSIFLPGVFILFRKRKGWITGVIILLLGALATIFIYFGLSRLGHAFFLDFMVILIILIISIPLILLLLDRKNFFRVAS